MIVGHFDIRADTHPTSGRDRAVDMVLDALNDCTFPWERCVPTMKALGRYPWPIEWEEGARDSAIGYVSSRRMWLALRAGPDTVAHELAHVADLWSMHDPDRHPWSMHTGPLRQPILELARATGGPLPDSYSWWQHTNPWSQRPIEAFTAPFTRAWFTKTKHHYPQRRFGVVWDDYNAVKELTVPNSDPPFVDLEGADDELIAAASWAKREGIVGGYPDGSFRGLEPLTRSQMVRILYRQAQGA